MVNFILIGQHFKKKVPFNHMSSVLVTEETSLIRPRTKKKTKISFVLDTRQIEKREQLHKTKYNGFENFSFCF